MVAVALLLGSVGSVLGLTVSTFADLQAALQVDEAVITVGADITVTESASDSAGLRVPAGVRATVSGPATLSGDGQFAILYVAGELNATALVFEGGYTGTYDESYDCGVDGNNYGDGGAVLVAANGRFHAKECDFLGNTGGWGGAIHVSAGAWAATTACVLSGNDAKGRRSCGCGNANCCGCTDSRGGAVFVSASGEYRDDNGLFLLNSALAGGGGGALYVTAGGTFAGWGTQFLDNAANNNDGQHVLVEDASVAASVACPAASSAMTSVEIGCGPGVCVFSLTNCRAPASRGCAVLRRRAVRRRRGRRDAGAGAGDHALGRERRGPRDRASHARSGDRRDFRHHGDGRRVVDGGPPRPPRARRHVKDVGERRRHAVGCRAVRNYSH